MIRQFSFFLLYLLGGAKVILKNIYVLNIGEDLMRLPVFAESVKKCDAVLKPRGIDIKYILTDKNPEIFDNVVNSFVGIATVQVLY